MAAPRVLGIKINKLSITVAELTKRVEALEAALEQRNTPQTPTSLPATKRRPRKKAS